MADDDDIDRDDEDLDDDTGQDDADKGDGKKDDWKPPATKAEFEQMVREHGNAEAKKWRLRAQGRDPKWKPEQGGTGEHGTKLPENASADQIRAAVRKEVEAEFQANASDSDLRSNVAVALSGVLALSDEQIASPAKARRAVQRVVNMINLKNLHLEDDGEISGLDDELAELRKDYPGMFKSGGTKRPATRGGDAGPKREGRKPRGDDDDEVLREMAKSFFGGSDD